MLLRFDGPVTQLAETMEADGTRECIPGLARPAPRSMICWIGNQICSIGDRLKA
jgi:hypothetical protein